MNDDEQLLMKRFTELAARAYARDRYEYSDFLSIAEQDTLSRTHFPAGSAPYALDGGYEAAERRLAVFGSEEQLGYPPAPPACWVGVRPASEKFADDLSHRDFLGSLTGLGLDRSALGDIVVSGNTGAIYCLDTAAELITSELRQVKRTTVRCSRMATPPEGLSEPPEATEVVVASLRLDAMVAAVYKLSRSQSQELFERERVFVNSRAAASPSACPSDGDIISVRGQGRFIYEGTARETKKNRLRITVRIY